MRFNLAAALCLLTIAPSWGATRSNSGFEIILYFSPKAAQELAFTGQDVAVDAMFYGDPAKAFASKADNMGRIALGEEKVINSPSVSVFAISGARIDAGKLRMIQGSPKVNVNVFSVLKRQPSNILECGIIDGDVPRPDQGPTRLHCKLIGEK